PPSSWLRCMSSWSICYCVSSILSPHAACFFFQAEDGIRGPLVTGVQTCALPISSRGGWPRPLAALRDGVRRRRRLRRSRVGAPRSEERRVGKECRSRGSPYALCKRSPGKQEGCDSVRQHTVSGHDSSWNGAACVW